MAVQKLVLDSLTDDYELIAIHATLPPYRIAFMLNKYLGLRFFRTDKDVVFASLQGIANYPMFLYEDEFQYTTYWLLGNVYKSQVVVDESSSLGLFQEEKPLEYVKSFLIPELKNVNYFLKIETETYEFMGKQLITQLLSIPQVITAYDVDYTQLKSKNNLIFE